MNDRSEDLIYIKATIFMFYVNIGTPKPKAYNIIVQTFAEKVREIVKKIPRGKVLTYKEVARKADSPNAFRAVGSIMAKNFDPSIPCHRVIKSDGTIGNYNRGGTKVKTKLLKHEGVSLPIK